MDNEGRSEKCWSEIKTIISERVNAGDSYEIAATVQRYLDAAIAPYRAVLAEALGESDPVMGTGPSPGEAAIAPLECCACGEYIDENAKPRRCRNPECWRYQGRELMKEE